MMKFIWPLADHYITRDFDYEASIYIGGQHAAVDLVRLQGDTAGREIRAVADGIVVGDGYDTISGHHIILMHSDGWRSTYRHLAADAPPVVGQSIAQGEVIGNVGSTGMSTGPHLHLDLWHKEKKDGTAFNKSGWWAHNPELYLGKEDEIVEEDEMKLITIKTHSSPTQWVTDGMTRWPFTTQAILTEFAGLGLMENQSHIIITDALMDAIPKSHGPQQASSGGGLTYDETVEANQEASRKGTG